MAEIRIKRSTSKPNGAMLKPGELAVAGTRLYFGSYVDGNTPDQDVTPRAVAGIDVANTFTDVNTFNVRPQVKVGEDTYKDVMLKGDIASAKILTINRVDGTSLYQYNTSTDVTVQPRKLTLKGAGIATSDFDIFGSADKEIDLTRDLGLASDHDLSTVRDTATNAQNKANAAQDRADSAYSLASSSTRSYSFADFDSMKTTLKTATKGAYKIGDNLFIIAKDVPDYWITGVLDNNSGEYGYYTISELEVDLKGCVKYESTSKQTIKSDLEVAANKILTFDGSDEYRPRASNLTTGIYKGNGNQVMLRGEYPIKGISCGVAEGETTADTGWTWLVGTGKSITMGAADSDQMVVSNVDNATKVVLPSNTWVKVGDNLTQLSDFGGAIKHVQVNNQELTITDSTVNIPVAADNVLGVIALGYERNKANAEEKDNYAVQLNSNHKAYVSIDIIDCGTWTATAQ